MGLIDKTKVKKEYDSITCGYNEATFYEGVSFAESELQNLAIEFADWISNEDLKYDGIKWEDKNGYIFGYGTKDLFSKFIEQRNNQ